MLSLAGHLIFMTANTKDNYVYIYKWSNLQSCEYNCNKKKCRDNLLRFLSFVILSLKMENFRILTKNIL